MGYIEATGTGNVKVLLDEEDSEVLPRKGVFTVDTGSKGYIRVRIRTVPHRGKTLSRYLAEKVLGCPLPPSIHVDHANANTLDNRRCNLRLATNRMNANNRPKANYVHWTGTAWLASLSVDAEDGKTHRISLPSIKDIGVVEGAANYLTSMVRLPYRNQRQDYRASTSHDRDCFLKLFQIAAKESENRRWQDKAHTLLSWYRTYKPALDIAKTCLEKDLKFIEEFTSCDYRATLQDIASGRKFNVSQ